MFHSNIIKVGIVLIIVLGLLQKLTLHSLCTRHERLQYNNWFATKLVIISSEIEPYHTMRALTVSSLFNILVEHFLQSNLMAGCWCCGKQLIVYSSLKTAPIKVGWTLKT